jgi:hypothetical protein
MSKALYSNWLIVADDGDHAGAGSKTVDSTGWNGNWIKITNAFQLEHNTPDGSHKTNIIDGPNLKDTIVDGVTLESYGNPKKFRVRDRGLSGMKIMLGNITADLMADGAIASASKILDGVITGAKIALRTITGNNLADATITAAKLADFCIDSVNKLVDGLIIGTKIAANTITGSNVLSHTLGADKLAHDNTARKRTIVFDVSGITLAQYAKHDGVQLTASLGVPMRHSGSVTGVISCDSGGSVVYAAYPYGTYAFAAGDRLAVRGLATGGQYSAFVSFQLLKNGTVWINPLSNLDTATSLMEVDIELGDA